MHIQTPPMGWNTWNTFGQNITEQLVMESADAMVEKGYKDAGYEYIVIDDCWSLKQRDENGVYRYALPPTAVAEKSLFEEAVLSVDYAMNTIVLKCRTGMAQGTCAAIDSVNHEGVVGTIAGDDTIFILVRSEADARKLSKKFRSELFPRR